MTRRDTITVILERWDELADAGARHGQGSDGDLVPLTAHDPRCALYTELRCSCWRQSLTELERLLGVLNDHMPAHHAHLVARYQQRSKARRRGLRVRGGAWESLAANEEVVIPCFRPAKPPDRVYDDVLVATWPRWVDGERVSAAVDWLERSFRGEPSLPREALVA